MSFRFQRRINLGRGAGVNLGKTGASGSLGGRFGAIGTGGFSLRSGIPGLSYRQSWGRSGGGAAAMLVVMAVVALLYVVAQVAIVVITLLLPAIWQGLRWAVLTAYDYGVYLRSGKQPPGDKGGEDAPGEAN